MKHIVMLGTNGRQITHQRDQETGRMVQIVSPAVLRAILREDGDDLSRPKDWGADDEWNVGRSKGS